MSATAAIETASAWAERMGEVWLSRAAEQRAVGTRGALNRAHCLESLVRGLKARSAAPEPEPSTDAGGELERLRASLAVCQPYLHPTYRMTFNDGPIMVDFRARLEARIAILEGKPSLFERMRAIVEAPPPPPRIIVPFEAGPQLEMFA